MRVTILSVPTRSGEAFGLFVIEALACGCARRAAQEVAPFRNWSSSPAEVFFMPQVTPALSLMPSKDCSSIPRSLPNSAAAAVKSSLRTSPAMRWPVILINCCSSYEDLSSKPLHCCSPSPCLRPAARHSSGSGGTRPQNQPESPDAGKATGRVRALGDSGKLRAIITRQERRSVQSSISRHLSFCALSCLRRTLNVTQTGPRSEFRGAANLGVWGRYETTGHATRTQFHATYRSKFDYGTFEMQRVSE